MAAPSVHGRERNDPFDSRDVRGEQIGLVLVGVHDIDLSFADESTNGAPRAKVERMPFFDFDVIDTERFRARIDVEDRITAVPNVADRDRESRLFGARRTEQDRLLRTASDAADASQFEHANRPRAVHPRRLTVCPGCATSASARAAS